VDALEVSNPPTADDLAQIAERVPDLRGYPLRAEPLLGGLTNLNYRIHGAPEEYVLRVTGEAEMLGADREAEYAATVMAGGVEQGLAEAVAGGLPPFAVVAVDGGGNYWHKRASGEDSGAMVLDELIPMLDSQGLDTSRVAFLGWSMGGYGALLLGARLGPARTAAISAVSPALWLSSGATAPGAFDGADDFAANSVFGLPALGSIPIRIDIGTSDPFYSATQTFIGQLPHPPAGGSSPGGHDGAYWSSQLPGELAWIAPLLTA